MVAVSSRERIEFTPEHHKDDNKVTYVLRPPTVLDRARWRRMITEAGASLVSNARLGEIMRDGVKETIEDVDGREAVLELLEAHTDVLRRFMEEMEEKGIEPDEAQEAATTGEQPAEKEIELSETTKEFIASLEAMKKVEEALIEAYPPYAQAVAARDFYFAVSRIQAVRVCLVSATGLKQGDEDVKIERRQNAVTEESLGLIPELDLGVLGVKCMGLFVMDTPTKNG